MSNLHRPSSKQRLDQELVKRRLVATRSQAESYIKLGLIEVNGKTAQKTSLSVSKMDKIAVNAKEQYVSRGALKLASVANVLELEFKGKTVLDVGSSTGGFTDYALRQGAKKVIAVEAGKEQLHPNLRGDPRIELHEQTDIRDYANFPKNGPIGQEIGKIDMVLIDVSFVSLREILPSVAAISDKNIQIAAMAKPQFEAADILKHKGVIKNDAIRREILKNFEAWAKKMFVIKNKADSDIAGAKGNRERFYLLRKK